MSSLHLTARNNVSSHSTSPSRVTQQTEWPQLVSIKEQKEQEEGGREGNRKGGRREVGKGVSQPLQAQRAPA